MLSTIERAAHLIAVYLDHTLRDLGLSQAEAHVLAELGRHGPASIGDLHRSFGHKRSTLTSVIDRLESRRYLRREINPSDRRSFILQLTRSGRATARRVIRTMDRLERRIQDAVSARDVQGLEAVAGVLAEAVQDLT